MYERDSEYFKKSLIHSIRPGLIKCPVPRNNRDISEPEEFDSGFDLGKIKKEFPESHLENLAFLKDRGLGVPASEDPGPDELEAGLEIRNAFNGPILAGLVAALYGGDDPDFGWDDLEPGVVKITVKA